MSDDQKLWGGETAKAVENFPISGETVPAPVIHWLARIKGAAAAVNGELGLLSKRSAARIEQAAAEIAAGQHDRQFPIDVFQTGSGTSTNMNANEVIARLAGGSIHANDQVNMGQSSNDVFPSAVHLAALDVAQNARRPPREGRARSCSRGLRLLQQHTAVEARADERAPASTNVSRWARRRGRGRNAGSSSPST